MLSYLTIGAVLGLSAGFAPGPLLALVVSETLQHDIKSGIKVALAPILTDLPIIIITVFILAKLARFQQVLGVISLIGGCLILYLGINNMKTKGLTIVTDASISTSLRKGILVNALSPHPYLFWFTVGTPTTMKALMHDGLASAFSFIVSFYGMLVGSKMLLAILTGKSRSFLQGKAYIFVMRSLGVILLLFALVLFRDGFQLFGQF
jgi:threonine/homoserine/homoserine lactone efflux protein